LTEPGPANQFF